MENHLFKPRYGIVAALAVLCCCSPSQAGDGTSAKLMADSPGSQGPEWVSYQELPEDGEIVSFNKAGDSDEAFELCQSEGGGLGSVRESQGGAVCDTKKGPMDSFYVLHVGDQAAEGVDEGEAKLSGLALKLHNELAKHNYEESVGGEGILPDFDWTKQEQSQLTAAIREGLEATDAWQRYLKDVPEDGRQGISRWSDYLK
jgi:hypothetical protein